MTSGPPSVPGGDRIQPSYLELDRGRRRRALILRLAAPAAIAVAVFAAIVGVSVATLALIALVAVILLLVLRSLDRADRQQRATEARLRAREEQFRSLIEDAPDAVVIVDQDGLITLINAQTEQIFGYTRAQLLGRPIELLVPEGFGAGDLHARRADGTELPVEIRLSELDGDSGLLGLATIRDVSERRAAEEVRRRLAAIVEHTDDAVFSATPAGVITSWNAGADRLYGHSASEAIGKPVGMLIPGDREVEEAQILGRVIAGGEVERYETVHVRRDGGRIDVSLTMSPVRDPNGHVVAASTIARDITERKRFEGQLQYLADHDALTGLYNRRRFEEDLERELARSRRDGSTGAVLAIDLDNFKAVNDSYGHVAGDELIKRASEIFKGRLRTTDVIARLGGDEFAVILPGTDADGARLVAAGLLQAIRSDGRRSHPGGTQTVTASIGIVAFQGGEDVTGAELLAEADIAMYDAKEAGRDRTAAYSGKGSGSERVQVRTTWPQRIRQVLDEGRLTLQAQPIVKLSGRPEARYELLVRMIGDDGELIPPGVFLHAAERYDLIQEIDLWVLREGLRRLAKEQRAGRTVHIGINLATKSIADPEFPTALAHELKAAGASGEGLWLEVPETSAILNVDRARSLAARLRELGCEFAVDDFGAGFASFYYLKHLAFDFVKIDSEFIQQLRESTTNQLVVQSIVDITRGLGKRTIAECVGDRDTVELLQRFGVDYAQGFYLGMPVPLETVDLSRALSPLPPVGEELPADP